jgi:hypothetical protein
MSHSTAPTRQKPRSRPPSLVVVFELEELPRLQIVADSFEDEIRLKTWLSHSATRLRLMDALLDAFEKAA